MHNNNSFHFKELIFLLLLFIFGESRMLFQETVLWSTNVKYQFNNIKNSVRLVSLVAESRF